LLEQSGVQATQRPLFWLQTLPPVHRPQLPLQPSSPQTRPSQLGWQTVTHRFKALQVSSSAQQLSPQGLAQAASGPADGSGVEPQAVSTRMKAIDKRRMRAFREWAFASPLSSRSRINLGNHR
jgi:hypothetical protein